MPHTPADVVAFWREAGPARWFARDAQFDARCTDFLDTHHAAARGAHDDWAATPDGALALLLVLDQIPRNVFRDSAHAFATDGLARRHAQAAIEAGHDRAVDAALRVFFYLPFEHSEALADQDHAVALIEALEGDQAATFIDYAHRHRDVIRRFGRFPHRNRALGRTNTADEQAWLDADGGF